MALSKTQKTTGTTTGTGTVAVKATNSLTPNPSPRRGGTYPRRGGIKKIINNLTKSSEPRLPLLGEGGGEAGIMKRETWKFIIQTIVAILTAIATSLGVTSCVG